jgi:8-oxo-dGTP diphosphatase
VRPGVDYIGVGVGAVIGDETGKVFMAKRGEKAGNECGLWEFPGGSVEFGETMRDALKREIEEEYGIVIEVGELLTVTDHILPDEKQHWVSPSFICRIISGTPVICEPEKCAEIGWFTLDALPDGLTQVTKQDVEIYRERMK